MRELRNLPTCQVYRGMVTLVVLARTSGKPLLFATIALGSFMTSVSQDLGFTSPPKDGASQRGRIIFLTSAAYLHYIACQVYASGQ